MQPKRPNPLGGGQLRVETGINIFFNMTYPRLQGHLSFVVKRDWKRFSRNFQLWTWLSTFHSAIDQVDSHLTHLAHLFFYCLMNHIPLDFGCVHCMHRNMKERNYFIAY